ncbi:MAG: cobalamin B12-binding domain-containing protein [Pseudomonadota bacterium]
MRSFTQDGSGQETSQGASGQDRWRGESGYAPAGQVAAQSAPDAGHAAVELRMALLARAIENEIIPRLMLAHRTPHECLTLPALTGQGVSRQDVVYFAKLVLARDEDVAHACVEAMRLRGIAVETIYLDLLAPVARYLGELWEQDLCDFTEVTLGLGRLQQVLRELSPAFGQAPDHPSNGRRILLLPSPGEQHTFGLVMVAEFFRRAGWDVAGGPWEAGADPVTMVRREWFDVVGFSMASELHLADLGDCIASVRSAALNPHVGIMVGGPLFASHPEYVTELRADAVSGDGRQAPMLAEALVASRAGRS